MIQENSFLLAQKGGNKKMFSVFLGKITDCKQCKKKNSSAETALHKLDELVEIDFVIPILINRPDHSSAALQL